MGMVMINLTPYLSVILRDRVSEVMVFGFTFFEILVKYFAYSSAEIILCMID